MTTIKSTLFTFSVLLCFWGFLAAQPRTAAEASGWKRTSTNAEVWTFLEGLDALPSGSRIVRGVLGYSVEGRPIPHVTVRSTARDPLRVLIIADIHGGEVEGKEWAQLFLREIARGQHGDLLARCEFHLVPVFNPDGNDEINRGNRVNQNGPDGGVGRRTNGQGFDLNRDFVKVEAPETRALLRLMNTLDPHLFMDLHTTNGSYHGYHLTYAPGLNPNQDPVLDAFMHEQFMPAVRAEALERYGVRAFDYGNTGRRRLREGEVLRWTTFSGNPRSVWNYGGMRNRLSVLSEAYSYLDFEARVKATEAFVLSNLRTLVRKEKTVRAICDAADLRITEDPSVVFGYDTDFAPAVRGKLLMGKVKRVEIEGLGTRLVALPDHQEVDADLRVRFSCGQSVPLPVGWVVPAASQATIDALLIHGVEVGRLGGARRLGVEAFSVKGMSRARARFQGHRMVRLRGTYGEAREIEVAAGTVFVRARQRLGRLAAQLLEPVSEDGLTTWNFFDAALERDGDVHPVLRVVSGDLSGATIRATDATYAVPGALRRAPDTFAESPIRIDVVCEAPGKRVTSGAYETAFRYEGRRVRFRVGDKAAADGEALAKLLASFEQKGRAIEIRPGNQVIHAEISAAAAAAREAGFETLYLRREPE